MSKVGGFHYSELRTYLNLRGSVIDALNQYYQTVAAGLSNLSCKICVLLDWNVIYVVWVNIWIIKASAYAAVNFHIFIFFICKSHSYNTGVLKLILEVNVVLGIEYFAC